ncbi:unnamed protein product [Rotaria magnacalcarata]|uniref:EF-hand domain-containing protein n=2 Tax=Rotaria magnacalcarata TaxID=392030 RepID=A0A819H1N0_9BILA|nr:unnamed protein product [Rotaria magnacalcarata]CAF3893183.1 unnamed protein product [Rotaria magnacalcarata]
MFTILPSLYLVATHYFRQCNSSNYCYYEENKNEEEIRISDNNIIHENKFSQTQIPNDNIQATDSNDKYDKTLLQHNHESLVGNHQSSTRSNAKETDTNLSNVNNDKDDQYDEIKSSTIKPNNSSSRLNDEKPKSFTGDIGENDMLYLMKETGFGQEHISLLYKDFLRDCPDGKLTKSKFIDIYKQFYKTGQVAKFCEHAFRIFDKDGSGSIDFPEFLIAVSMASTKDLVRKTELFFSMYDIDQNGLIDQNEMKCVVESIYELMGLDIHDSTRIDMKVQEIFAKAGCDQSGYLTKDQFALACKNDRYIRKLLVPKTKAPNNR